MAEFPKRSKQHVSGEQAVLRLKLALPETWIVREQNGDYGIDVEIEIAGEHVTGRIFKGQVKGDQKIPWTKGDNTYWQSLKASTLAYWAAMPVPVVVFVIDHETGATYWTPGNSHPPSSDEATGVRVLQGNVLPDSQLQLVHHVLSWVDRSTALRLLVRAHLLLSRWEAAERNVGYDCFLTLDDDETESIATFYADVLQTRQALGLEFADTIPWELWAARSAVTFGNLDFHWGTHDEVVAYLTARVREIRVRATALLSAAPTTLENASAKAALCGGYVRFAPPLLSRSKAWWAAFDERLRGLGALKFEAVKGSLVTEP